MAGQQAELAEPASRVLQVDRQQSTVAFEVVPCRAVRKLFGRLHTFGPVGSRCLRSRQEFDRGFGSLGVLGARADAHGEGNVGLELFGERTGWFAIPFADTISLIKVSKEARLCHLRQLPWSLRRQAKARS